MKVHVFILLLGLVWCWPRQSAARSVVRTVLQDPTAHEVLQQAYTEQYEYDLETPSPEGGLLDTPVAPSEEDGTLPPPNPDVPSPPPIPPPPDAASFSDLPPPPWGSKRKHPKWGKKPKGPPPPPPLLLAPDEPPPPAPPSPPPLNCKPLCDEFYQNYCSKECEKRWSCGSGTGQVKDDYLHDASVYRMPDFDKVVGGCEGVMATTLYSNSSVPGDKVGSLLVWREGNSLFISVRLKCPYLLVPPGALQDAPTVAMAIRDGRYLPSRDPVLWQYTNFLPNGYYSGFTQQLNLTQICAYGTYHYPVTGACLPISPIFTGARSWNIAGLRNPTMSLGIYLAVAPVQFTRGVAYSDWRAPRAAYLNRDAGFTREERPPSLVLSFRDAAMATDVAPIVFGASGSRLNWFQPLQMADAWQSYLALQLPTPLTGTFPGFLSGNQLPPSQ